MYATATGALNAARQIGTAIGVAILVALTGAGTSASGYRIAWIVMAAAGLLAATSTALTRTRAETTNEPRPSE